MKPLSPPLSCMLRCFSITVLSGRSCRDEADLAAYAQEGLLSEATVFRDANIVDVQTYDDLKAAIEAGKWARGRWAGAYDCLAE